LSNVYGLLLLETTSYLINAERELKSFEIVYLSWRDGSRIPTIPDGIGSAISRYYDLNNIFSLFLSFSREDDMEELSISIFI